MARRQEDERLTQQEFVIRHREGFNLIDKNGDGFITAQEYHDALMAFGHELDMEHIFEMIKTIDPKGDGKTLTFDKYVELMALADSSDGENSDAELHETFRLFDKDGNGQLSAPELQEVLSRLGGHVTDRQAEDIIKKYDLDGNGHIDFKEFVELYKLFA